MSPKISNTLTITQSTKLTDISDFLSKQKSNTDLLARKDSEGNTVLYTRGSTGKDFFRNIKDALRSETTETGKISIYNQKRELATKTIAGFLEAMGNQTSERLSELDSKVETPDRFNNMHRPELGAPVREILKSSQILVDRMLQSNVASRTGATAQLLTNLEALTGRVTRILEANARLKEDIPDLVPNGNKPILGSRPLDVLVEGKKKTVDAPMLLIDGKEFAPDHVMGKGGFGAVVLYTAEDGTRLAVKLPNTENDPDVHAQREKAARELFNTTRMIEGNPNATGFTSHVELEGGFVALIGEPMEHGDISSLAGKIGELYVSTPENDTPPSGKIGDFERRIISLTILKDAANGLAKINEKGLAHGDVKAPNMMISSDGTTKLIDLGEGMERSRITPDVHSFAENANFGAPEFQKMRNDLNLRNKEVVALEKEIAKQQVDRIKDAFSSVISLYSEENQALVERNFSTNLDRLMNRLTTTAPRLNNYDMKVDDSFDSFGLGSAGVELMLGGLISDKSEGLLDIVAVGRWAERGTDAIGEGGLRESTGQHDLDDLLNDMLSSDPKKRLSPEGVRDHYLMDNPAVGSSEARNLILAIRNGSESDIRDAVTSLRSRFNDQL